MNFCLFKTLLAVFIGFLLGSGSVLATERVANLYQSVIQIDQKSDEAIQEATGQGLVEVFNKVSGQKAAINHPLLRAQYNKPKRFLSQYRYDVDAQGQSIIVLDYDSNLVNSILNQANLPIWSDKRPSVLAWVVVNDGDKKRLLTPDNDATLIAELNSHAARRGIPLKLPLFDLDDATTVSPDMLWTLDPAAIKAAAQRYKHDALLIAKVNAVSDQQWMGLWNVRLSGQDRQFQGFKQSPKRFLAQGIDNITDQLAQQFAVSDMANDSVSETMSLQLDNIGDFKAYRRALTIIESIDVVNKALPRSFDDNKVIIDLSLKGSVSQFKQSMGLYSQFQAQEGAGVNFGDLYYQWMAQ